MTAILPNRNITDSYITKWEYYWQLYRQMSFLLTAISPNGSITGSYITKWEYKVLTALSPNGILLTAAVVHHHAEYYPQL